MKVSLNFIWIGLRYMLTINNLFQPEFISKRLPIFVNSLEWKYCTFFKPEIVGIF
jgi:hypothetical protein